MKLHKITVLLAATALACSCGDFLDVKPVGKLIPTKASEFDNILNNVNTISYIFYDNNTGNFLAFAGDNLRISDSEATAQYKPGSTNLERFAAYTYYLPYQDPDGTHYTWTWGIYRAAGLLNNVVEGIADLPASESDSDYARGVIAQARAARAWTYMIGCLGYGPMYDPSGANDRRTIPYRTAADPSVPNPGLATTAEIFESAFDDLEYALEHAPESVANPSRANLAAVNAILAEYYMYRRDWPNMLRHADEAWRLSLAQKGGVDRMIYDYNEWSYIPVGNPVPPGPDDPDNEVNWSLDAPAGYNQTYSAENLFYRIGPNGSRSYPSYEYIDLFDANDLRGQLFMLRGNGYSGGGLNDGIQIYNYRDAKLSPGSTENRNEAITFPLLLLTRAEAHLRTGDRTKALADLNTLRYYRYERSAPATPGSSPETDLPDGGTMSDDELMTEILRERRREQPIASFQRTLDLKRYVLDAGKPWCKTSITHTVLGRTHTAPIDDTYFTLPIGNTAILRNPAWGLPLNTASWTPAG